MNEQKLDPKYLEDQSEYLVEVTTKRPYFHREMPGAVNDCETRFRNGDSLAIHDALLRCERGGLPLPLWLSQAVRERVIDSLTGGQKGSRGRSNSPLGQSTKKLKQETHYRFVKKCQRISTALRDERLAAGILTKGRLELMGDQQHVFPAAIWERIEDPKCDLEIDDFGDTLTSNYSVTSKLLRGTFAQAEPRTIRKSYKTRQKSITEDAHRYSDAFDWFTEADPETLEALGLQVELSEAEMSAWQMGQEFVEPEADRTYGQDEISFDVDKIPGVAKKP
jgi:hypothetical protein